VIVASTIAAVRAWRAAGEGTVGDVGLVPTMGYLHDGHLALVRRARGDNARVVASLFVNPTQFGPNEDLARYPRAFERDRERLEEEGCALLFAPAVEEMYPAGATTVVDVGAVSEPLEGERRPGHFRGVATVVLKLLDIVQPTRAYFGEKDAQQLAVVRRLVADLDVPVQIVGCPIVREADGLAMSSRNSYLDPAQRKAAPVLHRALQAARAAVQAGERSGDALRALLRGLIETEPLARVDYVSVADPATFRDLDTVAGPALALLAVRFGTTRLIDNLRLDL
jgi:pantoate--beta-alanine ligase